MTGERSPRPDLGILRAAVAEEMRDSLAFEMALRFYAEGGNDGGELARQAIKSRPSDVHISELTKETA